MAKIKYTEPQDYFPKSIRDKMNRELDKKEKEKAAAKKKQTTKKKK